MESRNLPRQEENPSREPLRELHDVYQAFAADSVAGCLMFAAGVVAVVAAYHLVAPDLAYAIAGFGIVGAVVLAGRGKSRREEEVQRRIDALAESSGLSRDQLLATFFSDRDFVARRKGQPSLGDFVRLVWGAAGTAALEEVWANAEQELERSRDEQRRKTEEQKYQRLKAAIAARLPASGGSRGCPYYGEETCVSPRDGNRGRCAFPDPGTQYRQCDVYKTLQAESWPPRGGGPTDEELRSCGCLAELRGPDAGMHDIEDQAALLVEARLYNSFQDNYALAGSSFYDSYSKAGINLIRKRGAELVPYLVTALAEIPERRPSHYEADWEALLILSALEEAEDPRAVDALIEFLQRTPDDGDGDGSSSSPRDVGRCSAICALGRCGKGNPKALCVLEKLLWEEADRRWPHQVQWALSGMGAMAVDTVANAAEKAIQSDDGRVASHAIGALIDIGEPARTVLPALLEKSRDPYLIPAALGVIGVQEAVRLLCLMLARRAAEGSLLLPGDGETEAFVSIGKPAAAPLMSLLRMADETVKNSAIMVLGETGDRRAREPLSAIVMDRRRETEGSCALAKEALSKIEG